MNEQMRARADDFQSWLALFVAICVLLALPILARGGEGEGMQGDCSRYEAQVYVNQSVAGYVEGEYFVFYRLDITESGYYRIFTVGDVDLVGQLLDRNCYELGLDDDGGDGLNFQIERYLEPNTYFIGVRGFSDSSYGSFNLVVEGGGSGGRQGSGGYGGDCRTAEMVNPGQAVSGRVSGLSQQFFSFDISSAGDYSIYTSGPTDTYGTLYDSSCIELDSDDDGGQGTNFLIQGSFQPGTYHVAVRGYSDGTSGPYTLYIEGGYGSDGGGDCRAAEMIYPGQAVSGRVSGRSQQFFRFDVSSAVDYRIYTSGPTDTYGTLYDSSCIELDSDDDGGQGTNFLIQGSFQTGTYYVSVRGYSDSTSGPYTLYIEGGYGSDGGGGGGDCRSAEMIYPGQAVSGQVSGRYQQFFRFDVSSAGDYSIYTSGSTDTYGTLYDSNCIEMESDDDGGQGTNFLIQGSFQTGTYYVSVRGYSDSTSGPYTLYIEGGGYGGGGGGDCRSAEMIYPGRPVSGQVSGRYQQFFRFDISSEGNYQVYTTGSTDTYGTLYDSGCGEIERNDDGGQGTNFLIAGWLARGTYHIAVRGFGDGTSGPYTLYVEGGGGDEGGEGVAAGSDCRSAEYISVGQGLNIYIAGRNESYFRFDVSSSGRYRIFTFGSVDTFGTLLDEYCRGIASNDDGGQGTNFLLERELSPGTYYIAVRGYSDSSNGSTSLYIEGAR